MHPLMESSAGIAARAELLWPAACGPVDLAAIEAVPLSERGLPASSYNILTRAATLWPERPAVSVMTGGAHWDSPETRTFGQLRDEVN